jgi:hypothetical protein
MNEMMAAMEVMMGTLDPLGGRGGCGSRITDKGLKMGSKGKRRGAKLAPMKSKPHATKSAAPTAKVPPPASTKTGVPQKRQV